MGTSIPVVVGDVTSPVGVVSAGVLSSSPPQPVIRKVVKNKLTKRVEKVFIVPPGGVVTYSLFSKYNVILKKILAMITYLSVFYMNASFRDQSEVGVSEL